MIIIFFPFTELRRAGLSIQKRAIRTKEQARGVRNNALFKIKESEVSVPDPYRNSSFIYYCCRSCTPSSRVSLGKKRKIVKFALGFVIDT